MSNVRLIDAKALVGEFKRFGLGEHSLIERFFADGVYTVIETAPTIDAVPVIRCKDCVWGKNWKNVFGVAGFRCDLFCADTNPEAFCSCGEVKDND